VQIKPCGAHVLDQAVDLVLCEVLKEGVVDLGGRGTSARANALHLQQRDQVVGGGLTGPDAEPLLEAPHHLAGSAQQTG
jgi:hypothetical protein